MDLVLFLVYFFPPLGGGGVQRSAKFVKYLPENSWQPIVITVEPNRRNSIEQGLDYSLLDDLKRKKIEVVRCRPIELSNLYYLFYRLRLRKGLFEFERWIPFLHMDYKIGWYWSALRHTQDLLRKYPVKIIYSSSPPYSTHLVGLRLQKHFGLPWIADFRDPWTQIATYRSPTRIHSYIDYELEKRVLWKADAIIANTESNKANLVRKYDIDPGKIQVIPNGFDPLDFVQQTKRGEAEPKFVISCIGKFYEMPDPWIFFQAYRKFADKRQNVVLKLVGWHSRAVRKAAEGSLKKESWYHLERVEHNQAVQLMQESSILVANLPNQKASHWIPGKLYEYLAAEKPILLIGPKDGDAARMLERTGSGKVAGFDPNEIHEALEGYYNSWSEGFAQWQPNRLEISKYDRRIQTRDLAQIFRTHTKE